jgi:hypothetical protein
VEPWGIHYHGAPTASIMMLCCYCHSTREEFMSFLGLYALLLDVPCMSSSALFLWKSILIEAHH